MILLQDRIFSVWLHNLRLRNRILEKRIQVEKLKKEIKLYRIIFPQVSLLKQWAKLDKRNQESVGSFTSVLSTLSLRLPLLHGAKVPSQNFYTAQILFCSILFISPFILSIQSLKYKKFLKYWLCPWILNSNSIFISIVNMVN